jgi:hypothetical protein
MWWLVAKKTLFNNRATKANTKQYTYTGFHLAISGWSMT